MVDGLVFERRIAQASISTMLIGMQRRTGLYAGMDFSTDCISVDPADGLRLAATAAFPHAKNRCLADRAASGMEFLDLVLVAFLAADIGLVPTIPRNFGRSLPHASRSRPRTNHAVF